MYFLKKYKNQILKFMFIYILKKKICKFSNILFLLSFITTI